MIISDDYNTISNINVHGNNDHHDNDVKRILNENDTKING